MATAVNLTAPAGWNALSQAQLRFLLGTMASVQRSLRDKAFRSQEDYAAQSAAQVAVRCLFEWNGMRVVCAYGSGWLAAKGKEEFVVDSETLASAAGFLGWAKELPNEPVRLERVDGATAAAADLSADFSFDDWLSCETLWQVYQLTTDNEILRQMAEILYRKKGIRLDEAETLGVFYWWASVKTMVSEMFPDFFSPASSSGESAPSADDLRRIVDSQIRALTKGDVTKEKEVLALPAMRALAELDAQARDFEELNRKYPVK